MHRKIETHNFRRRWMLDSSMLPRCCAWARAAAILIVLVLMWLDIFAHNHEKVCWLPRASKKYQVWIRVAIISAKKIQTFRPNSVYYRRRTIFGCFNEPVNNYKCVFWDLFRFEAFERFRTSVNLVFWAVCFCVKAQKRNGTAEKIGWTGIHRAEKSREN